MPAPHRLLFVSHEMTLSGAPIQLAYLAQELRERGWDITVVAPEPGPLAAKLFGIELVYESQLLIDPAYGALRRLAAQFEAVVANTVATWEAVQACHLERVPVVWYIHETRVGQQLMQLVHMIEPSLALADKIVVPTRATARIYERFVRKPMEIVPYGIPAVEPIPAEHTNDVRVTVIGTLESRKGQDLFLEAVRKLTPAVAARASFHLAGRELEEAFVAALRDRAAALPNVEFCGALDHAEAMRLLNSCDVLACPSRDETMPIILLEAMSLGKPIICTDVGGISEFIRDGVNGLVVPSEDAEALAAAISTLIHDAALRHALGAAGRATFERHFTIDAFGERFAGVIERTIAANRSCAS